jgi:hypothetical protein
MSNLEFKLNPNTVQEGDSFEIANNTALNSFLQRLKDNTDGFIEPKPIRDAMITAWANNAFKETYVGSKRYIGIDTLNPSKPNKDLKLKMLFGKRSFDNVDILDETLISNDTDIYFFNTKEDLEDQNTTKLSFLAGTDSDLYADAPYISSQFISDVEALSMSIVANDSISFKSDSNTTVNNIKFPNTEDSESEDINNKILIYNNSSNELDWGNFVVTLDNIGDEDEELNMLGRVNVNGFPLDFTDDRKLPVNIGGLIQGETFGANSISELLKRIVYPNQAPDGSLEMLPPFDKGFAEVGTFPNPKIQYTIVKKTNPTVGTILRNMNPSFYEPIGGIPYKTIVDIADAIVISPITTTTQTYTIEVSDGTSTSTDSVSIKGVYPYFFGVGNPPNISNSNLSFLSKIVEDKGSKTIEFIGEGKIFLLYPIEYGELDNVEDKDGNVINTDMQTISYSSPEGYWASKEYYLYSSVNSFNLEIPTKFTFNIT